jgi:hypothetical protein
MHLKFCRVHVKLLSPSVHLTLCATGGVQVFKTFYVKKKKKFNHKLSGHLNFHLHGRINGNFKLRLTYVLYVLQV